MGNENPIHIEIGMGKGRFLSELAALHPDINYVGIEKYSSVLLRAIEKQQEVPRDNLKFIRMDAEEIAEVFAPDEVERIYLNFSDPWPEGSSCQTASDVQTVPGALRPDPCAGGPGGVKTGNRLV